MSLAKNLGVVLFLGLVRRGEFETLQSRGLPLAILVDKNNRQRLGDVSRFVLVQEFDFSRPIGDLIEAVREIEVRWGIACLFNVIEFYVAQTADVALALRLPFISPDAARLCLDKNLMRTRFQERMGAGHAARFFPVESEAELLNFADQLGYPVFLQPANVSASMWATRNADPSVLLQNYRRLVAEVPKYYEKLGKKETKLAIALAEYLEGANYSVDCVGDRQGEIHTTPVVDVLTGKDIGIDDYHHFARLVPSRLSDEKQKELQRLAVAGMRALEMHTCSAHVEFIGSRLGEIAARPGGNRPRILELAFGIDLLHGYFQALMGGKPDLQATKNLAAAIITPFPSTSGSLRSIRHLEDIPRLPTYLYHEIRGQTGQAVGLAKNGCRSPLYIELKSEDAEAVRRDVDLIASWTDLYEIE